MNNLDKAHLGTFGDLVDETRLGEFRVNDYLGPHPHTDLPDGFPAGDYWVFKKPAGDVVAIPAMPDSELDRLEVKLARIQECIRIELERLIAGAN